MRCSLLGQRSWESEARSVYTYVMDRIAEENGVTEPHFGRPAPPFDIPDDIRGPAGFEEDEDTAIGNRPPGSPAAALLDETVDLRQAREVDLELLQEAGYGIAVGDASDELKEIADLVTEKRNGDGFCEAVERLF